MQSWNSPMRGSSKGPGVAWMKVCAKTYFYLTWDGPSGLKGSFSNDYGDGEDDTLSKTNLYFTFEWSNLVNVFSTPIGLKICPVLSCTDSAQFQKKIPKISHCGSRSPKYLELGHFTLLFCKEMYQDSKRTCTDIVLLIKPFVWCRSRRRRRRGLLKLPNNNMMTSMIIAVISIHNLSSYQMKA